MTTKDNQQKKPKHDTPTFYTPWTHQQSYNVHPTFVDNLTITSHQNKILYKF